MTSWRLPLTGIDPTKFEDESVVLFTSCVNVTLSSVANTENLNGTMATVPPFPVGAYMPKPVHTNPSVHVMRIHVPFAAVLDADMGLTYDVAANGVLKS
jgi:hypothetical protein